MKNALRRMDELRKIRDYKLRKAEEIEQKCLSVGNSHIFESIGESRQRNRRSPQERMAEAVDLRKSAYDDLIKLLEMQNELEPEVDSIKDYDTRFVIQSKYLRGWPMIDISDFFRERSPNYVYELERAFFQS